MFVTGTQEVVILITSGAANDSLVKNYISISMLDAGSSRDNCFIKELLIINSLIIN